MLSVDFKARMKDMLYDYEEFIKAMKNPPESGIRINEKKAGAVSEVLKVCGKLEKIEWCGSGYYADKNIINGKHPYHHAGLFYFQEPSAMAVGEAADIRPDDKVLDLCAAPGGKSTHIGAKLGPDGLLVANEVIPKRAAILAENLERFGINAVVLSEFPEKLEKRFAGFFDKIIVDAPCSGEGMFRKEEQAVTDWSLEHSAACAVRQSAILNSAAKMLAEGGYIIYSTCTFAPCENEAVTDRFLNEHPEFELCDIPFDMLSRGDGRYINSERDFSETIRIFPHRNRGEGHFIARMKYNGISGKYKPKAKGGRDTKEAEFVYRRFEKNFLNCSLNGEFELFGTNLYLRDKRIGSLDRLKTVRAGLHLGECILSGRGNMRFEPSHALALYLNRDDIKYSVSYPADSAEINAYLSGAEIKSDITDGWCVVCVDGFNLGWGKASGGVIKNKYPKKLRNYQ